ncbi:MAG: YfhO family protein [Acidimicrobiales bacterium]|nr:YfhO family protein [Acidimicrobiales bacterium]
MPALSATIVAPPVAPVDHPPVTPTGRGLRWDLLVVVMLTALTAAYFNPLLRGHTSSPLGAYQTIDYPWAAIPNPNVLEHPQNDYAELSYPWNVITDDALREGTIPLWSPLIYGGGYEFFANGSSAVLYPPRLLALAVTSPVRAHDLFLVFHIWAAGIAMYLLARQLSVGRWAGTFAAVAWMFATWNLTWMHLEVVTPIALFLPATVAAVHRAMTRHSARAALTAGLVCALAVTSGHLLFVVLVLIVAAGYGGSLAVGSLLRARWPRRGAGEDPDGAPAEHTPRHLRRSWGLEVATAAGRLALRGVVALGAAAVVLVPTFLALRRGQRVPFTWRELQDNYLAEPWMLKRLFLPQTLPIDADQMQYLGFVGFLTPLFALVGVLSRRRPGAWFARTVLVVVPLIMIGTPLAWVAWRLVPGMNVFRPYSRLVVFVAFAMVVAAAIGVQVVLDAVARRRPGLNVALRIALVLIIVGTAGHLMYLGRRSNPLFIPHEARFAMPPTPLVEELHARDNANGWPQRTMPVLLRFAEEDARFRGVFFYANTAAVNGIDTTAGYDSSLDARTLALLRVLDGADPADPTLRESGAAFVALPSSWSARFELAGRLGITTIATMPQPTGEEIVWSDGWADLDAEEVYASNDGVLYAVPGAVAGPRLIAADDVVPDEQTALERFTDAAYPAASQVLVEADELERTGLEPLGPAGSGGSAGDGDGDVPPAGAVTRAERGVNTASIDVEANTASWLVVPDAWAEGWTAQVNGRDVPVVRVNYYQRAVQVGPGASTVTMRYRPPGFVAGATVSALSLALALVAALWLSVRAWAAQRRSARRRLQFEHELIPEQAGVERHTGLVDPGHEAAHQPRP